jgi:hypothetical protein
MILFLSILLFLISLLEAKQQQIFPKAQIIPMQQYSQQPQPFPMKDFSDDNDYDAVPMPPRYKEKYSMILKEQDPDLFYGLRYEDRYLQKFRELNEMVGSSQMEAKHPKQTFKSKKPKVQIYW